MNELEDAIRRARAQQKGWIKHMKLEGWHSCPVCKSAPIMKDQKICAQCEYKMRKARERKSATETQGPSYDTSGQKGPGARR